MELYSFSKTPGSKASRLACLVITGLSLTAIAVGAPAVSVTLTAKPAGTIHIPAVQQLTAAVTNSSNKSVTWQVNGIKGGNATVGTIDTTGKYTAPAMVPSSNAVVIQAVSAADPTKTASTTVQLMNPVPQVVAVSPSQVNVNLPFSIVLTGSNFGPNATVTLDDKTPVTVTSCSATQITFKGTSASAAGAQIHVLVNNPGAGATSSNSVLVGVAAPVAVTVWPKTATLRGLTSTTFSDKVANAQNAAAVWAVNGVAGGNSTLGTIDVNGVYTAPAVIPMSVTITATSSADPTKSDWAAVTLQNPVPVITSSPSTVTAGSSPSFAIAGTGFSQHAQVMLGGTSLTVKWNSSTQLTASSGPIPSPVGGTLALQVVNPDPGSLGSNIVAIAVKNTGTALSYAAARRFLEQASWGSSPASIAHVQDIGIDAWINEQFDTSKTPISTYSLPVDTTTVLAPLQSQFFMNALTRPDQLRQRVAFALGQIAVVSGDKLPNYYTMEPYQQMLLNDAFGKYSDFIKDVTLSPSMGHYLDMVNNDIGTTQISPDENYARELMQLFTIGLTQLNPDGTTPKNATATYTEDDIRGLARVLTGWTYPACSGTSKWVNAPCFSSAMVPIESHHDNTAKVVLGTTIQTGSAERDLESAFSVVEGYPSTDPAIPNMAPFVCKRLIQHLVTANPDPAYVARVSAVFARSGGDLKQVVKAILEDVAAGYGNNGADLPNDQGHLREPVLYAVSLLRNLGATVPNAGFLSNYTSRMEQDLFKAESVFNYYSPFYTIPGTTTVSPEFGILDDTSALARANYAYTVANSQATSTISIDFSNLMRMASDTNSNTQTASMALLLNTVSQTLLGGPMPSNMQTAIMPALLATNTPGNRVANAVFLVAASPQYQVVR